MDRLAWEINLEQLFKMIKKNNLNVNAQKDPGV